MVVSEPRHDGNLQVVTDIQQMSGSGDRRRGAARLTGPAAAGLVQVVCIAAAVRASPG